MVRYRRLFVPGGTFFFTVALADRQAATLTEHIDLLRGAFRLERKTRPFTIEAAIILPDHFHLLLTLPEGDRNFSTRLRIIKTRFTQALIAAGTHVPRRANGEHDLWQRRLWEHCVRDEADFERHADYIHFNPVKHGLAHRPADWPYSSIHKFIRAGILPEDWAADEPASADSFGERPPPQQSNRSPD